MTAGRASVGLATAPRAGHRWKESGAWKSRHSDCLLAVHHSELNWTLSRTNVTRTRCQKVDI
jgi:hypothetical protein